VSDDVVQEALDTKNPVFEDGQLLDQFDFSEWFFNSFVVPRQVQDEKILLEGGSKDILV